VIERLQASGRRHAVYELAPGLLLVFKPRGHREAMHGHAYGQRLRVLRGALEVRTARGAVRVAAGGRPLRIAAGRAHATRALADTWLIAERWPSPLRAFAPPR
jgi:quercetin dioxygenase-like cupin family protein